MEQKFDSDRQAAKLSQNQDKKIDDTAPSEQQDFETTSRDNAAHSISTMTDLTGTNQKEN